MAKEQKQEQDQEQQPKHREDYEETLLVRNPQTGEINAVADLRQTGNKYAVHTTQPLTKNQASFFDLKNSGAVAAFIRGFKSQAGNPIDFQFLKVPFNKVQEVIQSLLKLDQNPNDEEGKKALREHYVDTMQLERVKFEHHEIPRAELRELGIDFDGLPAATQRQMMLGLPVTELVQTKIQVSSSVTIPDGYYAPRFYRDHNDQLKVALDSPLARPEYEQGQYEKAFSTQEKAMLDQGRTLERLVQHKDPLTGQEEWCFVGKNPATNRLIFQPKKEVPTPSFTYRARISDEGRAELDNGGSALVEGCHYNNSDNHFSGKIHYDIHRGEYVTIPTKYERPYVPTSIREQLSDKDYQALCNYQKIDGATVNSRSGKPMKGCDIFINPQTNILSYQRREQKQEQSQSATQQQDQQQTKSRGVKM